MIKVLLVIIFLMIIFIGLTHRYKNRFIKDKEKSDYKMYAILGTGLFVIDFLPKKIIKPYIRKLSNKYRQIYVSGDVKERCYLYVAEKICESLVCLIIVFSFVLVYLLKNDTGDNIKKIKRPNEDMIETSYNLATNWKDTNNVDVVIYPKEYSEDEIDKIFDKRKEECIKQMLADNESVDKIYDSVNLEGVDYPDGVKARWKVVGDYIGVDGSIDVNKSDDNTEGETDKTNELSCKLILTMSYKDITKEYDVNLKLLDIKESLQQKVQKYIDDQDRTNEYVELPEKIENEKISFNNDGGVVWVIILVVGVGYAFAMFFIRDFDLKDKLRNRHEEMIEDYPEILNKFLLLIRAGLGNVKALEKIISEYENGGEYRYAYEEIRLMINRIKLGEGEEKAYEDFSKRCNEMCYSKFASLLSENLKRGNSNLGIALEEEVNRAWKEKENILRIKGERTGTKLIFPMILILIVTLVMIIIPAFMSMKGV